MNDKAHDPRRCPECGGEITGRTDKRFCCEACRNRFNNRKGYSRRRFRDRIESALEKNYSILLSLLEEGISNKQIPELEALGFCPEYVTGFRQIRGKSVERYCFDVCYLQSDNRLYKIRRLNSDGV